MKNFKLVFRTFLAVFVLAACSTDRLNENPTYLELRSDNSTEIKVVPFKGNFESFPVDVVLIDCVDPDSGAAIPAPSINAVSGNATHLGLLDVYQSSLIVVECVLDPIGESVITTLDMYLVNSGGDGIHIFGESTLTFAGPSFGNFEIIEGFGKFEGASGSIETTGFFNFENGTTQFRAEGFVTQPNH